jgi:hypothetical protein
MNIAIFFLLVSFFFWDLYQAWSTSVEPNINYLLAYLVTPSAIVIVVEIVPSLFPAFSGP